MDFFTPQRRALIRSGLGYGGGLLLGHIVSYLLFKIASPRAFTSGNALAAIIVGLLLAFLISGIGGLIGGFIGGYTLSPVGVGKGRWGYAWRSGVTFGIGYGLLLFPVGLVVSLLSFADIENIPAYVFTVIFGVIGGLFGLIMGGSFGVWTIGRRFPRITRWVVLGFAIGGACIGYFMWLYIFSLTVGIEGGNPLWGWAGLFLFGFAGGVGLGYAYYHEGNYIKNELDKEKEPRVSHRLRRWLIAIGLFLICLSVLRPIMAEVGDLMTPIDAGLATVLDLPTDETHWLDTVVFASTTSTPTIVSGENGRLSLAWVNNNQLMVQHGAWDGDSLHTTWGDPITIADGQPSDPQIALDENGRLHLIWLDGGTFQYSQCDGNACTGEQPLPASSSNSCAIAPTQRPTLASSGDNMLLVWESGAAQLPFATWPSDVVPASIDVNCVPNSNGGTEPYLVDDTLVFATTDGDINAIPFDGVWGDVSSIGRDGYAPTAVFDNNGDLNVAWCSRNALVLNGELVDVDGCKNDRFSLAYDENNTPHIVWYGDTVENANNVIQPASLLYETSMVDGAWTRPAIISNAQEAGAMVSAADGTLHLTWADGDQAQYAAQQQYACDTADLTDYGQVLYDVARQEKFTPAEDIIPYCQNRYDQLLISPNPNTAYSDASAPVNGVFDLMADDIRQAQYEVLFSTMWYDKPANHDSPGSVIAAAVADLYRNVKAYPEQYPRGMTVRIMLGNPPELVQGEPVGQLWVLIDDLRYAGVEEMVNDEIGWRVQVADYEGQLPHAHVKTLVIDGRTGLANGFNMSYGHFDIDHPSGKGNGRFDLGVQMTGPVAQATQRMFDDMWAGSDERYCFDLNPPLAIPWQATCFDKTAVVTHIPEVQKFYIPTDADSTAFSMYRSKVHPQADDQAAALLASAAETIDSIHVQFSLDMICNLNLLFDVCSVYQGPEYIPALIEAAQNGVHVRLIVKPGPFEGVENAVALDAMFKEIDALGISDNFEVRYFDGDVHPKSALVDGKALIIGSQNFHYSAYGDGSGLNEYSMAVENEQVIDDYTAAFEYQWQRAAPAR